MTANIESACENMLFRLAAIINLPQKNINGRYNVNLGTFKNLLFEQKDNKTKISLTSDPTKEVPYFGIQLEAPDKILESIFGGELEQSLPDLIKKSGIKFDV